MGVPRRTRAAASLLYAGQSPPPPPHAGGGARGTAPQVGGIGEEGPCLGSGRGVGSRGAALPARGLQPCVENRKLQSRGIRHRDAEPTPSRSASTSLRNTSNAASCRTIARSATTTASYLPTSTPGFARGPDARSARNPEEGAGASDSARTTRAAGAAAPPVHGAGAKCALRWIHARRRRPRRGPPHSAMLSFMVCPLHLFPLRECGGVAL